jgi:hypothetical protein
MDKTSNKSNALLSIIVGAILALLFTVHIFNVNNEVDTKTVGGVMQTAAVNMSKIESVSGTSIDESYYQEHGNYLAGEAKIYNANTRIAMANATTAALVGLTLSLALIAYGIRSLRSV